MSKIYWEEVIKELSQGDEHLQEAWKKVDQFVYDAGLNSQQLGQLKGRISRIALEVRVITDYIKRTVRI